MHAGHRHFDPACLAGSGAGIYGVGMVLQRPGGTAAKGTFVPAEGGPEYDVAIPPEDIFARISGDLFSRPVEKQDSPIDIVGNYALHHIIENTLKVLLLSDKAFKNHHFPLI
jgi:hypothetical protein